LEPSLPAQNGSEQILNTGSDEEEIQTIGGCSENQNI
jgi:hypothetical protein